MALATPQAFGFLVRRTIYSLGAALSPFEGQNSFLKLSSLAHDRSALRVQQAHEHWSVPRLPSPTVLPLRDGVSSDSSLPDLHFNPFAPVQHVLQLHLQVSRCHLCITVKNHTKYLQQLEVGVGVGLILTLYSVRIAKR